MILVKLGLAKRWLNRIKPKQYLSKTGLILHVGLTAAFFVVSQQDFVALGSAQTIILKTSLLNSGDDAFLPRLTLRFPDNIHYVKVLQNVSESKQS